MQGYHIGLPVLAVAERALQINLPSIDAMSWSVMMRLEIRRYKGRRPHPRHWCRLVGHYGIFKSPTRKQP